MLWIIKSYKIFYVSFFYSFFREFRNFLMYFFFKSSCLKNNVLRLCDDLGKTIIKQ